MKPLHLAFFASAIFLLFSVFFHNIIEFEQDLGRHLLMGKIISQTLNVPKINLFSYTHETFPFINTHWFSEVLFFQLSEFFGSVISLLYLKTVVLVAAFGLTVHTTYRQSKNLLAVSVAFLFLSPVLLERTEIRPEIFSYLLTAIFFFVLLRPPSLRFLLVLPLLQLLWVNLHIYFILGPILVFIFLLQDIWNHYLESHNFSEALRESKYLIFLFLLVLLSCLVNPNFLSGAAYPLRVFDNYGYSIVENQNIFFLGRVTSNPNIFYFKLAIIIIFLSFLITDWKKLKLWQLLVTGLLVLPALHIRSFPLAFLVGMPILAINLANFNPNLVKKLPKNHWAGVSILLVVIIVNLLRSIRLVTSDYYLRIDSSKRFGSQIRESGKPGLDFVLRQNLNGPLFNNFDVGSYLDYRLHPKEKVFVDGRPEAYPKEFFQGIYIPMQMTKENFETVEKIYDFKLIIFSHTDSTPWAEAFLGQIINNQEYRLVFLDGYLAVFVRTPTDLKTVSPEEFFQKMTVSDLSSSEILAASRVGQIFGWQKQAVELLEKAHAANPKSGVAKQVLSQLYLQDPAKYPLGQKLLRETQHQKILVLF